MIKSKKNVFTSYILCVIIFITIEQIEAAIDRKVRSAFSIKQNITEIISSLEKPAFKQNDSSIHPRTTYSKSNIPINPSLYKCGEKLSPNCLNKTKEFKKKVLHQFEKHLNNYEGSNFYNVSYHKLSIKDLINPVCNILKNNIKLLKKKDVPKKLKFILPKSKLLRKNSQYKSCVIVSSASSLTGSKLGKFIDLHEIVLRFNNAPTKDYEVDVGKKTSIRILNSQVVSKDEYNFLESDMFKNISLAAWDSGKYGWTVEEWLENPDFNLFVNYEKYLQKYPESDFHLINPISIWKIWELLEDNFNVGINKNPPSSGFLGVALLLPHCEYLDIVEYVPSTRLNPRCHYYSEKIDVSCTFGSWHPLAAEKLSVLKMNSADDFSVYQNGIIRIRRKLYQC